MADRVEERELAVDGVRVFCRQVQGEGTPVVYCHGNPGHGEDWLPFLERGGRAVAIDMPGWGRSEKPRPRGFDYSMHGLSAFLERCLEELGVERRSLVMHDWGSLALIGAQQRPELAERLVLIDAVPLLPGYRWHWVARIWRRRVLGEILTAASTRTTASLLLRQARGDRGPMPPEFIDSIWRHWDRGTRAALLALYRDAQPDRLEAAGRALDRLGCPSLVLWGDRDPYVPGSFGEAYARALPGSELEIVPGVGHWPWIEEPALVDRVVEFVA